MNTKKKSAVTVAVVEDNDNLRTSLREILEGAADMTCVATCATGNEAMTVLPALRPAVVFMDINLPGGMDGVECVRQLARVLPQTLVIMLTIQSNIQAVFQSLQAGACGFLHKPVYAKAVLEAVREVVAGGSPMTAGIARQVVQAFKAFPSPCVKAEPLPELTAREHEVLRLLTEGCLYKEIADQMAVSWHTVHNHIRHIYEKLQVRSRTQAIAKYRGQ
jgi:DNA-binding NarL/FixJ family response regulator